MASGKKENDGRGQGFGDQNEQVDATVLQYQNQRLFQQLEAQKAEMHALERKFKELRERQNSYDKFLIAINKMWNQLVDDLVLLGLRAGGDLKYLQALDHKDYTTDATCAAEETFLCRLLGTNSIKKNGSNGTTKLIHNALASRHSATLDLMKYLQESIAARRAKNGGLALVLQGKLSPEDSIMQVQKFDESLKEAVNNMHEAVDILNQKHKQYADEMQTYVDKHPTEQSDIKRLSGELEEIMAELEENRRKLAILQMQKHGSSLMHVSATNVVNGSSLPNKSADKTMCLKDLKDSIEEAKTLAESRLLELHEAQEDMSILSKQLVDLQAQLKDGNYITSSKPYSLLNDQLQHLNTELARYKVLIESLQADRNNILAREKELMTKSDSIDATQLAISNFELKIEELENQIQKFLFEKNEVEIKYKEAQQDLGRKDIKDEIHVMVSALSKEIEMMETQLNRSKEAAAEALSLREEANSLRDLLNTKVSEHKLLSQRCDEQMVEMKTLKALIENLEKEKQELHIFLDMHGQECLDTRTITEIKESEHKARRQAELLKATLEEHSLELRVKAANDAQATCQQRLSIAEAGIPELQSKLDASERDVLELKEAIRIKDAEAEAYISEIETIGQAYEDMQTQNQHLLQQVAERDDYNIKLVSESVKMKQTQSSLLSEKQALSKRLQQVNGSLEFFRMKAASSEDQMKTYVAQAVKSSFENRNFNINHEKTKLELVDAEKELKWLRSTVAISEKEFEQNQRKIAELRTELERERIERKRLQEEYEEVKAEVMEMSSENEEATIQKLQDEIKECKAILKCGVCFDRPKEVVITKCFHLFCYPCIQRNLEIRHRKCPGCGTPFGQNDVREVKI